MNRFTGLLLFAGPCQHRCVAAIDAQLLKNIAIFRALDDPARASLASQARIQRCAPRDTIVEQGVPAPAVYVVSQGRAKVSVAARDGRTVTIRELGPGEIIGEVSLFDGGPPSATVTALTEVELVVVDRASFITLLERSPQIAVALLSVLASRLRRITAWADDLAGLPVSARLAKCLLGILAEHGQATGPNRYRIGQRISQQALAERIGVTRESINKHLKRLGRAGILVQEAGHLVITDRAALEAAAADD
jgi:CRP/FNR family transcriptional regulator, cyclic AMP receptor protein